MVPISWANLYISCDFMHVSLTTSLLTRHFAEMTNLVSVDRCIHQASCQRNYL